MLILQVFAEVGGQGREPAGSTVLCDTDILNTSSTGDELNHPKNKIKDEYDFTSLELTVS